jgi:hypothetical protein
MSEVKLSELEDAFTHLKQHGFLPIAIAMQPSFFEVLQRSPEFNGNNISIHYYGVKVYFWQQLPMSWRMFYSEADLANWWIQYGVG